MTSDIGKWLISGSQEGEVHHHQEPDVGSDGVAQAAPVWHVDPGPVEGDQAKVNQKSRLGKQV